MFLKIESYVCEEIERERERERLPRPAMKIERKRDVNFRDIVQSS